jgi:hypothetical protein
MHTAVTALNARAKLSEDLQLRQHLGCHTCPTAVSSLRLPGCSQWLHYRSLMLVKDTANTLLVTPHARLSLSAKTPCGTVPCIPCNVAQHSDMPSLG